jgi:hypothetical protein
VHNNAASSRAAQLTVVELAAGTCQDEFGECAVVESSEKSVLYPDCQPGSCKALPCTVQFMHGTCDTSSEGLDVRAARAVNIDALRAVRTSSWSTVTSVYT